MLKIWSKFLLKKFWKLLISLLFSAFAFYTLIHHALHSLKGTTPNNYVSFFKYFEYYFSQLVLNLEFILPQLLSITTVIVLSSMQSKREVVFLKASGLSLKKFTSPLIISSLFLSGLLYINFQWIYPYCEEVVNNQAKKTSTSLINKESIPIFYLKDQTLLSCSNLDTINKTMHSVIWIKNSREIYKMKTLSFHEKIPVGQEVVEFSKNQENNEFILTNYFSSFSFKELEFQIYDDPFSNIFLNKNRNKLFSLYKSIPWKALNYGFSTTNFQRLSNLVSQFFYKLFSPLACIIATIIPIRYCLKFNRIQLFSFSYLISLGTVNLFFICLKSAIVLTTSNVLPAFSSMAFPMIIFFLFASYQFFHIK